MCGHYTEKEKLEMLIASLQAIAVDLDSRPRYNIAPSQMVAVILNRPGGEHREGVTTKQ